MAQDNPYDGQNKRYVIVHYIADGDYYTLVQTNWGQFHYDNAAKALETAEALRPSLKIKLGIELRNVMVIHTECWLSGDCCRTVFPPELVEVQKVS